MRLGDELRMLEAAGRDDHEFVARPNVCIGERVTGRIVYRGRQPCVAHAGGMAPMADRTGVEAGAAVEATVVEQIGQRARAYDVVATCLRI